MVIMRGKNRGSCTAFFWMDFEIIPFKAVRGQIFWGDGSGGQWAKPPFR